MTSTSANDAIRARLRLRVPPRWSGVEIGDGWLPIVDDLDRKLAVIDPTYELYQCKSKFGGLRYYCEDDGRPEFRRLIGEAEALSTKTCELCGKPGEQVTVRRWVWTLCAPHRDERIRLGTRDGWGQ